MQTEQPDEKSNRPINKLGGLKNKFNPPNINRTAQLTSLYIFFFHIHKFIQVYIKSFEIIYQSFSQFTMVGIYIAKYYMHLKTTLKIFSFLHYFIIIISIFLCSTATVKNNIDVTLTAGDVFSSLDLHLVIYES